MLEKILKAKHWQVFLVICGLPFMFYILFVGVLLVNIADITSSGQKLDNGFEFEIMSEFLTYGLPLGMFLMLIIMAWFYALGVKTQEFIHEELRMKTGFFKFSIVFPMLYMVLVFGTVFQSFDLIRGLEQGSSLPGDFPFNPGLLFLILPLHFFTFFCQVYNIYFAAKAVKTAELQRKVTFGDYIGEMVLIWFYPIGIWFIQPKVNVLSKRGLEEESMVFVD